MSKTDDFLHGIYNISDKCPAGADLLLKHFCNCLYLGEWELAKACGRLLQGTELSQPIVDVLFDVCNQPFNRRYICFILSQIDSQ